MLRDLAMWEDWQRIVEQSLPKFCASPIYVQQRSQSQEDFERAAEYVASRPPIDPDGKLRDVEFGAVVRDTRACGRVTRMWIDSCVEINFLQTCLSLRDKRVLDIGAGYGRLAVPLSPMVESYTCVDAVPISTTLCRLYTSIFAPEVKVVSLDQFEAHLPEVDLAINIHSWNECSFDQVREWLDVLVRMRVTYLFVVSNGHLSGGKSAYATWGGKGESFRPLLEERFGWLVEEEIGLSEHPHSLWHIRSTL